MSPSDLAQVLCHLDNHKQDENPNLLVGFDLMDDAGVYKISEEMALVQTVDFFTPVVDDPYMYGQIAAANALSDIYAMGAKPLTTLSIACFSTSVESEVLAEILKGGQSKIKESGAVLLGGHTVTDEEVKYGLSVTGTVEPTKVITNSGARPGDVLILTKPIGTGILTTAFKLEMIGEQEIKEATVVMSTLNKVASEAMQKIGVHACTDITGFGLLGHSLEMAKASNVQLTIDSGRVPVMDSVLDLIERKAIPGGTFSNMRYFEESVSFHDSISKGNKIVLFDAQTSGGMLIAVSEDKAQQLLEEINKTDPKWAKIIGQIEEKDSQNQQYITVV